MKKALVYGAGLIALYLVVKNGPGFSTAATGIGTAGGNLVSKLQGH